MTWLTFGLLAAAVASAWLPSPKPFARWFPPWFLMLALACICGAIQGLVAPIGIVWIGVLSTLGLLARNTQAPKQRVALSVATALFALAMALHLLPGFANPKLYDAVLISQQGPAFTQYLNFDKAVAGLVLIAALAPRSETAAAFFMAAQTGLMWAFGTAAVTAAVGVLIGFFAMDTKVPPSVLAVLVTQLFFVCAAEQAFFRGAIQEVLHRWFRGLDSKRFADVLAIGVASFTFALVHLAGGPKLFLLALISGLGAGIAYAKVRSIEAPILVHFVVNATHLFLLTYPYRV